MLLIGSHVSFKKNTQLMGSLDESLGYGSNTFMFYTGAPQNTNRGVIDDEITEKALLKMNENGIDINKVIVHAPYIINLANSAKHDQYRFSIRFLIEECKRCEALHIKNLVLHPGSHVGCGVDNGIDNIINALNEVLEESSVRILLESMAGKGTEIGRNFDEIKRIIDGVKYQDKIGICLDTCHLSDAGYDVSNFDAILDELESLGLLEKVGCVHVNDSKNPFGSHKDRHANIGYGFIGFDNIINIIYNKRLEDIPKILETPWIEEYPPYKYEIEMIRNKKFNENLVSDVKKG